MVSALQHDLFSAWFELDFSSFIYLIYVLEFGTGLSGGYFSVVWC